MATLTPIQPSSPVPAEPSQKTAHRWLKALSPKTVLFYLRPFLARWLKAFKQPSMLVVSQSPYPAGVLQKALKPCLLRWMSFELAVEQGAQNIPEAWDLILVLQPHLTPQAVSQINPMLKKGGALILVTQNSHPTWLAWQQALEAMNIADTYAVGFHPQGAVAWWPIATGIGVWPGKLLEGILSFFPGRRQVGLRFGRCWMIRGLKRDDITLLT